MRTAVIIVAGFVLWGICLGIARFTGIVSGAAAAYLFVFLWLVVAAINMYFGVTRAGYSVKEELPIFLLIFLVPAVVAALVNWKFPKP
jgi:hypothetical protein